VSTLHQVIEDLQADMALCKRSLASGGGNTNHGLNLDVPKPSPFVGKQKARAVEDFLWEMEQNLEDLAMAIAHAEALIDFSTRRDSSKPKDRKVNHEKGEGEKNAQSKVDQARKPPIGKDKNLKTSFKSDECFICDGPHRARDCPEKALMGCQLMKTKTRVMAEAWVR
nr:putative retrotransposon Gag domain, nucleotide-binding alpha-beta plait domain protein [Tanacetum cinerariifolium]